MVVRWCRAPAGQLQGEKRRAPSSEQQQSSNKEATRGPDRPTMRTPAMGQWYTRTGARDVPLGAAVRRFTSMRDQRGSGQRQRLGRGTIQSVMLRGGENETGWPLASPTRHPMCACHSGTDLQLSRCAMGAGTVVWVCGQQWQPQPYGSAVRGRRLPRPTTRCRGCCNARAERATRRVRTVRMHTATLALMWARVLLRLPAASASNRVCYHFP